MTEESTGEPSIMLCLSQEDKKLGSDFALSPEDLGAYACITLVMDGVLACRILRESATYREVWVAAGNELEATRLAAGIKAEAPWRTVYLVQRDPTASARSRAHEAGLDGVLSLSELVWRCETFDVRSAHAASVKPPVLRPEGVPACPRRTQPAPPAPAAPPPASPKPPMPVPPATVPAAPALSPAPLPPVAAAVAPPPAVVPTAMPPLPPPTPLPVPAAAPPLPPIALGAADGAPAPAVPCPAAVPVPAPPLAATPSAPFPMPPVAPPAYTPQPQTASCPPPRAPGSSGSLISVVSGSGGSGKSTVAALLARQANRRGLRTALVDGDLQFGDLATIAAASVCVPLDEVVAQGFPPAGFPQGEPVLFSAPLRLEAAELVGPQLEGILQQLLAQFDVVVVNTGGNWGDAHAMLLEKSMATLMLIDQRSSSVRACRHALDLCLRCGIATNAFVLALNRCSKQARFSAADVSEVLHGARVAELSDGGAEVEEMMGSGLAEALVHGGNPLAASIDRLLGEVLPGLLPAAPAVGAPLGAPSALPPASAVPPGREGRRRGSAKAASPRKRGRLRRRSAVQAQ